jgi:hypothetical protein
MVAVVVLAIAATVKTALDLSFMGWDFLLLWCFDGAALTVLGLRCLARFAFQQMDLVRESACAQASFTVWLLPLL